MTCLQLPERLPRAWLLAARKPAHADKMTPRRAATLLATANAHWKIPKFRVCWRGMDGMVWLPTMTTCVPPSSVIGENDSTCNDGRRRRSLGTLYFSQQPYGPSFLSLASTYTTMGHVSPQIRQFSNKSSDKENPTSASTAPSG